MVEFQSLKPEPLLGHLLEHREFILALLYESMGIPKHIFEGDTGMKTFVLYNLVASQWVEAEKCSANNRIDALSKFQTARKRPGCWKVREVAR